MSSSRSNHCEHWLAGAKPREQGASAMGHERRNRYFSAFQPNWSVSRYQTVGYDENVSDLSQTHRQDGFVNNLGCFGAFPRCSTSGIRSLDRWAASASTNNSTLVAVGRLENRCLRCCAVGSSGSMAVSQGTSAQHLHCQHSSYAFPRGRAFQTAQPAMGQAEVEKAWPAGLKLTAVNSLRHIAKPSCGSTGRSRD